MVREARYAYIGSPKLEALNHFPSAFQRKANLTVTQAASHTPQTQPYHIVLAEVENLTPLSHLLNDYRVALGLPNDQPSVAHYLFERLINHESVIFLALDAKTAELPAEKQQGQGFLQMYPTFSSKSLMPVWILGEVYVAPKYRRQGLAQALINQALELLRQRGDEGLVTELPADNSAARHLYERMGFQHEPATAHYAYTFPRCKP